jgi:hypothetical protein
VQSLGARPNETIILGNGPDSKVQGLSNPNLELDVEALWGAAPKVFIPPKPLGGSPDRPEAWVI